MAWKGTPASLSAHHTGVLADQAPRDLLCVELDQRSVARETVTAGIYVEGSGDRFWKWQADSWQVISSPEVARGQDEPTLVTLPRDRRRTTRRRCWQNEKMRAALDERVRYKAGADAPLILGLARRHSCQVWGVVGQCCPATPLQHGLSAVC